MSSCDCPACVARAATRAETGLDERLYGARVGGRWLTARGRLSREPSCMTLADIMTAVDLSGVEQVLLVGEFDVSKMVGQVRLRSVVTIMGANLGGANLGGANLVGANLVGANLVGWERGPDGYARRVPS